MAWAILHAGKSIENRHTNIVGSYRGPVLIHASKTADGSAWVNGCACVRDIAGERAFLGHSPDTAFPRGGIVGRARIVGVFAPMSEHARDENLPPIASCSESLIGLDLRWWERDHFGIVLADVVSLPFVSWKGRLGLFDVPDDYATRGT